MRKSRKCWGNILILFLMKMKSCTLNMKSKGTSETSACLLAYQTLRHHILTDNKLNETYCRILVKFILKIFKYTGWRAKYHAILSSR